MKRFLSLALTFSLCNCLHAAGLDRNGNSLNDAWELLYGNLPANADPDGDGYTNAQESAAGTNPNDPGSRPPRLAISPLPDSLARFDWDSVAGKRYRLLSRPTVDSGAWNTNTSTTLPINQAAQFFRLSVDDVDTDADGLTDWEERALGFDPSTGHSARQDATDLQAINAAWTANNIITIAALDPEMSERWNEPGLVAIRRKGNFAPLIINFALSGQATLGSDYTVTNSTSIALPMGARETWIEFHPLADADDLELPENIVITLLPGSGYTVGSSNVAALTIENETANGRPSIKSAARFLVQAAFGPDQDSSADFDDIPENVEELMSMGFEAWIDDQFQRPLGLIQPWVDWAVVNGDSQGLYGNYKQNSWWARAMGAPKLRPDGTNQLSDPLRQRVAFALSQILVVSDRPEALAVEQAGVANYYDLMIKHAFGNYYDLLIDVATHPVMGIYLSHLGNQKADKVNRIYPDENFAREIMQLFTIGLWQLNPDGSRKLNAGQPIPTYNNGDITELARVFTGFSFGNNIDFRLHPRDFTVAMKCWDEYHDCEPKTLLGGLQLSVHVPSPGNAGLVGFSDLRAAVSNLFVHPNVGPFIGRQLIQRLVTSNPSPEYIARVSAAFDDNGAGVRGDMKAVVKAILLDPEARDSSMLDQPTWGKLREPLLRVVNLARAFNAYSASGHYALDQFALDHAQDPMNAPSVFNFFLPAHSPPGPITQLGLVAPEFQILNASTAITGPNYFWNAIGGDLHRYGHGNPDHVVRLNLDQELAMIVPAAQIPQDVPAGPPMDPDPLLRRLDVALTGGTLSAPQFQIIREAMLRVSPPSWQWHRERLRLAIYLIVTSPDFNVLR